MVQLNLLPDVKLAYVKAQQMKRLMTTISIAVGAVSLLVLILMLLFVNVVQKKSLHDLNGDISTNSAKLHSIKDLSQILTLQNQLNTLGGLHDKKPVTSRTFAFLSKLTPAQASLNQLTLDFSTDTMTIGGSAPSLDVVSNYTDILKSAVYTASKTSGQHKAYSNVVLSSFGRDSKGATFVISTKFDPALYDITNSVNLATPTQNTAGGGSVFGGGQ